MINSENRKYLSRYFPASSEIPVLSAGLACGTILNQTVIGKIILTSYVGFDDHPQLKSLPPSDLTISLPTDGTAIASSTLTIPLSTLRKSCCAIEMDIDQTFGVFLVGTLVGTIYFYLVTSYSHPEALSVGVWSINGDLVTHSCSNLIETFVQGLTIILSQSFFARRVYLIGASFRFLVLVAIILLVGELGLFAAATAQAFIFPKFVHFQKFTWLISAGAAMAVVADGLLTSVLVTVLRQNTTGMKRMDTILDILILYAISTGLLTSVVNFLSFIFSLVNPGNLIYAACGLVATKLYANSLLAALNSRKYLAERAAGDVFSSSLINPDNIPTAGIAVQSGSTRFAGVPVDSADGRTAITFDTEVC
ncbi:hypothetical protein VTO73DRAFT_8769 [Trametes versicolor]